jgi:hypothetical protein
VEDASLRPYALSGETPKQIEKNRAQGDLSKKITEALSPCYPV